MSIRIEGKVSDASGRALPGTLVSNGESVVRADSEGRYAIEAEPGTHSFVFVTVPDGYATQEKFYRTTPTRPANIDFTLDPAPKKKSRDFNLAHLSDTHLGTEEERVPTQELLSTDLRELEDSETPDLIVCTGDLTEEGTPSELDLLRETLARTTAPFVPVWGGHDSASEYVINGSGSTCTGNFEKVLGPVCFSFDWGDRHFVAYAAEDEFFSPEDAERKERWLVSDLTMKPKGLETVILMHPPPTVELLDLLADYDVSLVLHGHTHISNVFTYRGITVASVTPTSFGGIDTNPRGYRMVRFTETGFGMELKALGRGESSAGQSTSGSKRPASSSAKLEWELELPGHLHRSEPIARGTDLLLALSDEHGRGDAGVYCLSTKTGERRWHARTDASVRNNVALGEDGTVVALSTTGGVYAIDASSGAIEWRATLPEFPSGRTATSPATAGDFVYAGAQLGYGAFALETGEQLWYTPFEGTNRPCYASPTVLDDTLAVHIPKRGIVGLRRRDGEPAWEQSLGVEFQYPAAIANGDTLVAAGDPGKLVALDVRSGEVVWHREAVEYTWAPGTSKYLDGNMEYGYQYPTSMVADEDQLYYTTSGGTAIALDLETGDILWTHGCGSDLLDMTPHRRGLRSILARPVVVGNELIVCGIDGVVYVLDSSSGESKRSIQLPAPIAAAPVVTEDGLCVGTWNGYLYCFSEW